MSASVSSVDDYVEELRRLEAEVNRRRFLKDPTAWCSERMQDELWSGQRRILKAVAERRRTAVKSCHEIGKSFIAARIVAWWLDSHPVGEAFAVTTAPTANQVQAILWREIGRAHSKGKLKGRVNQTEWFMTPVNGKEEIVAFGRKPSDYEPTAFQGIHASRVLVVFDEATGIPELLWDAADSLIANDFSKFLAIGNPDDPNSEFYEACKPGSGYHVIEIGAFDTPNFTGEALSSKVLEQLIGRTYVEEKRRKWAPNWFWVNENGEPCEYTHGVRCVCPPDEDPQDTNPLWQSKILGKFPKQTGEHNLIPIDWIVAAQHRTLAPAGPTEIGVDVGGGGDSSTGYKRNGPVVRRLWEDHNPDTMHTCGMAVSWCNRLNASIVKVDEIGIGRGVVDRGKELGKPFVGINVGASPDPKREGADRKRDKDAEERFVNLRAQNWWGVRELFERGEIDIDALDEDLAGELAEIRFKRTSSGLIQIESKDDAKRRGVPSPNRADALMLAVSPTTTVPVRRAVWGKKR